MFEGSEKTQINEEILYELISKQGKPKLFKKFEKFLNSSHGLSILDALKLFSQKIHTPPEITEINRWIFLIEDVKKILAKKLTAVPQQNYANKISFFSIVPQEIFTNNIFMWLNKRDIASLSGVNRYLRGITARFKNTPAYSSIPYADHHYSLIPTIKKLTTHEGMVTNLILLANGDIVCTTFQSVRIIRRNNKTFNFVQAAVATTHSTLALHHQLSDNSFVRVIAGGVEIWSCLADGKYAQVQNIRFTDASSDAKLIPVKILSPNEFAVVAKNEVDHQLEIWRRDENNQFVLAQSFQPHRKPFELIKLANGNFITHSKDKELKLWIKDDKAQFNCIDELKNISGYGYGKKVSHNNELLIYSKKTTYLFSINETQLTEIKHSLPAKINLPYFSPQGELIFLINTDIKRPYWSKADLQIWKKNGLGEYECKETLPDIKGCINFDRTSNGELLIYMFNGIVKMFRKDNNGTYLQIMNLKAKDDIKHSILLDSGELVTGDSEGQIIIWQFPNLERKLKLICDQLTENDSGMTSKKCNIM